MGLSSMTRMHLYSPMANRLACLSDVELKKILANADAMHEGIGGKSSLIKIDDEPVFVKKIPLTDFELKPKNRFSTANLFDLPLNFQYGVGSAGFNAWRELATHVMTTNWVVSGKTEHFPMMYHWRILSCEQNNLNINEWGDLEKYYQYWEHSLAIQKRVEALNQASSSIVIFLEYIPKNLHQFLQDEMTSSEERTEKALVMIDKELNTINDFMLQQNLIHFDAHFNNILTDGKKLYLTDFGLALSTMFDLSDTELEFFKQHQAYDKACTSVFLLHGMITTLFGRENWKIRLQECAQGRLAISPTIAAIIKKHAEAALTMDEFFQKLQKVSKATPYPAIRLDEIFKYDGASS